MSTAKYLFFKGIHPEPQNNICKITMHRSDGLFKYGSVDSGRLAIKFKKQKRLGEVVKFFNLENISDWSLEGITDIEYSQLINELKREKVKAQDDKLKKSNINYVSKSRKTAKLIKEEKNIFKKESIHFQ